MRTADPAGLGRGPLTRRLPVLGQATPEPPPVQPYDVDPGVTPGRFLARVLFSIPAITVPAMGLAIVWQVGESAVPVVMGVAIDRALATGDASQLVWWLGVLTLLYVALTLAARFAGRLNVTAVQLLQHRLRATLSVRVLHPVAGTGRPAGRGPDGGLVSTMTNDVGRLSNGVLLLTIAISRAVSIGFIAVSLLAVQWVLGVVVLAGAPLVVWLMGRLSRRLSRSTREYQNLLAATVGRAADLVAGYRVVKGIRAEPEAVRRYERASQETLAGAKRNAELLGRFQVVSGALNGLFVAAVTGLGGWFAVDGRLSVGGLITTVGLAQALLPQIAGIAGISIPNLVTSRAAAARILDALDGAGPAPGAVRPDDAPSGPLDASVPVLGLRVSGVAVTVAPGELVGIRTDDRGAALIVEALLDPYAPGRDGDVTVLLDGRPAGELAPAQYRARVVVAPHRTTLFTGTIRENLDTPGAFPVGERLPAALEAAACGDFAVDLDVVVGENGNRLSGGQRQRVALARALASDASVLVLHDPTTAVDPVTEQVIADRLPGVRRGRSTVLLASSAALLGGCDRVVELDPSDSLSDKVSR